MLHWTSLQQLVAAANSLQMHIAFACRKPLEKLAITGHIVSSVTVANVRPVIQLSICAKPVIGMFCAQTSQCSRQTAVRNRKRRFGEDWRQLLRACNTVVGQAAGLT